jgi:hypothetical protein
MLSTLKAQSLLNELLLEVSDLNADPKSKEAFYVAADRLSLAIQGLRPRSTGSRREPPDMQTFANDLLRGMSRAG